MDNTNKTDWVNISVSYEGTGELNPDIEIERTNVSNLCEILEDCVNAGLPISELEITPVGGNMLDIGIELDKPRVFKTIDRAYLLDALMDVLNHTGIRMEHTLSGVYEEEAYAGSFTEAALRKKRRR